MRADGVDFSGIPERAYVEELERTLPRRTDEAARAAGTALSPDELVRLLCGTGLDVAVRLADCKLASAQAMGRINRGGGRFITVLPRSRKEDAAFRA